MKVVVAIIGVIAAGLSLIGVKNWLLPHQADVSQLNCDAINAARTVVFESEVLAGIAAIAAGVLLFAAGMSKIFAASRWMLFLACITISLAGVFSLVVAVASKHSSCSAVLHTAATDNGSSMGLVAAIYWGAICALTFWSVARAS